MIRVRKYRSSIVAEAAAGHLRASGIPAMVVGHHIQSAISIGFLKFAQLDVVVPTRAHVPEADRLLDEFEADSEAFDEGELDEAMVADLSKLDPGVTVDCPSCGRRLPLEHGVDACPACADPVDVLELIVTEHGPDALADCYEAEPAEPTEADVRAYDLACAQCRYSLAGLEQRGRCPECGTLYDKLEILARMM